ncbi:hypothetical protein ASPBRDRAFT_194344 [Aspergillus brasiliensis CBS 101740]|uniref:Uncharacterized protein n=1 Tax=Aspergillus brasiliensis (strain CBS 101740 / IMI 381727 / IBT 21946) TaxID=767769 RepID=A0A1L9UNS1_ASPBC|nr:hypothetical protein ASPBRDRAFT_194344 [Aspergillus brasiliensis CBS 101740]
MDPAELEEALGRPSTNSFPGRITISRGNQAAVDNPFHLIDVTTARENSILYSEISALVEAMRGRANQREVDSRVEREKLYEDGGRGKEMYPYLFSDEEYFPVLVVSCVMPQHARLFTACMSQWKLVIRQSKLYSFEWRDEAPVDLFTRLFLSRPLGL